METLYTVDESVGSVSVCVNLTQPQVDIRDITVNVFVIDYPNSVYIPPDAPLESKPLINHSVLINIPFQPLIHQIFLVSIFL